MSNDTILMLLAQLEEAARLKNTKIQESFNKVAQELMSYSYGFHRVTFTIAEIEFGCTSLGDGIKGLEAQAQMGRVYIHKTTASDKFPVQKLIGMDITCGSEQNFASIFIRGINIAGKDIKGSSECLRAILASQEEGFAITEDLSMKIKSLEEKPFLRAFKINKLTEVKEIKIGKRKSIKEHNSTDLLLRASTLANPDGRQEMIAL